MVMSFQGKRLETAKDLSSPTVKDWMTKKLVAFSPDTSMEEAIHTLISKRISGAPVTNDQGHLVGVISEGDCLKEVVKGKYLNSPNKTGLVQDYMTTEVISLPPDTPLLEAAQLFLARKIRRFPIVEKGKLIGLLSQSDIMRATYTLKSESWSS